MSWTSSRSISESPLHFISFSNSVEDAGSPRMYLM